MSEVTREYLFQLRVLDLKQHCKILRITQTGNKEELVERIFQHYQSKPQQVRRLLESRKVATENAQLTEKGRGPRPSTSTPLPGITPITPRVSMDSEPEDEVILMPGELSSADASVDEAEASADEQAEHDVQDIMPPTDIPINQDNTRNKLRSLKNLFLFTIQNTVRNPSNVHNQLQEILSDIHELDSSSLDFRAKAEVRSLKASVKDEIHKASIAVKARLDIEHSRNFRSFSTRAEHLYGSLQSLRVTHPTQSDVKNQIKKAVADLDRKIDLHITSRVDKDLELDKLIEETSIMRAKLLDLDVIPDMDSRIEAVENKSLHHHLLLQDYMSNMQSMNEILGLVDSNGQEIDNIKDKLRNQNSGENPSIVQINSTVKASVNRLQSQLTAVQSQLTAVQSQARHREASLARATKEIKQLREAVRNLNGRLDPGLNTDNVVTPRDMHAQYRLTGRPPDLNDGPASNENQSRPQVPVLQENMPRRRQHQERCRAPSLPETMPRVHQHQPRPTGTSASRDPPGFVIFEDASQQPRRHLAVRRPHSRPLADMVTPIQGLDGIVDLDDDPELINSQGDDENHLFVNNTLDDSNDAHFPDNLPGNVDIPLEPRKYSHKERRCMKKLEDTANMITEIVDINIELMSQAQFLEFSNYEEKRFTTYQQAFADAIGDYNNLDLDDPVCNQIILNKDTQALKYLKRLDAVKKKHFMHLKTGDNLLKKVDLSKFSGDITGDTIYEFLDVFSQLADTTLNPSEKANLLFNTYLSDRIKSEVQSFKGNYEGMINHLIARYGDMRVITDQRIKRLEALTHPKNNPIAKVEYYRHVESSLLQLQSLTSAKRGDCIEARNTIYNMGFVNSILKSMPEAFMISFCKKSGYDSLGGQEAFIELLKHVQENMKTNNHIIRIRGLENQQPKVKEKVNVNTATRGQKNRKFTKRAIMKANDGLSWPCQVCPANAKHEFGHCKSFWTGNNYKRRYLCNTNSICNVCFKRECFARDKTQCCSTSMHSNTLICPECLLKYPKKPSNYLTCPIDHHSPPDFEKLEKHLQRYLKVFDTNQFQKLKTMDLKPPKKQNTNRTTKDGNNAVASASTGNAPPNQQPDSPSNASESPVDTTNISVHSSLLLCQVCKLHPSDCSCNASAKRESYSSPFDPHQKTNVFDPANGTEEPMPVDRLNNHSNDSAVYIFQHIQLGSETALVFYDSGASLHCIKGALAEKMKLKVTHQAGDYIGAIGGGSVWTAYGCYRMILKDKDDWYWELELQGMSKVTDSWPLYDFESIHKETQNHNKLKNKKLPLRVGGKEVDILIGIKASGLSPVLLCTLPSGISVYQCKFTDAYGSNLAFGGSHAMISLINQRMPVHSAHRTSAYLTQVYNAYRGGPRIQSLLPDLRDNQILAAQLYDCQPEYEPVTALCGEDLKYALRNQSLKRDPMESYSSADDSVDSDLPISSIWISEPDDDQGQEVSHATTPSINLACEHILKAKVPLKELKNMIDMMENDDLVDFRCSKCSECEACKKSPALKSISLKEAFEQTLIENSVRIDYDQNRTYCKLPWTRDPIPFLQKKFNGRDNFKEALGIYITQAKRHPTVKDGIRNAFNDLLSQGFMKPLSEMPQKITKLVENSPVNHFYPWRAVQKPGSLSTPFRIVVDPSKSGLNMILAKGTGGVAKLVPILTRSRCQKFTWTADISKLYNQLWLEDDDYPFSLMLYHASLDPNVKPEPYLMLRAWYGVVSTGGQAHCTLKRLGEENAVKFPLGSKVLLDSSYVDDLLPGSNCKVEAEAQVKETQTLLALGGFKLKFVCHSNDKPPDAASSDAETLSILGYTWNSKEDTLTLGVSDLNFHKKMGGAKPENPFTVSDADSAARIIDLQEKITRRMCLSKSAEIYDPLGIWEPLKAKFKRDLSRLNGLEWDENIPTCEESTWRSNFMLFPLLKQMKVHRAVTPQDIIDPNTCRLIIASDASLTTAGACVYIGYKTGDNNWSNSLLQARSQICKFSIPRNELTAIFLAAELCYAVCHSLQPLNLTFTDILFLTDSTVALSWCYNAEKHQKTFVHNRVTSIHRFFKWTLSLVGQDTSMRLVHIPGEINPSDIITKGQPNLMELGHSSKWQGNWDFLMGDIIDMPLTSYEELCLSPDEAEDYNTEFMDNLPPGIRNPIPIIKLDHPLGDPLKEEDSTDQVNYHLHESTAMPSFFPLKAPGVNDSTDSVIDFVKFGWAKATSILETMIEAGSNWIHKTHISEKIGNVKVKESLKDRCLPCKVNEYSDTNSHLPLLEQSLHNVRESIVNHYVDFIATRECLGKLSTKELEFYERNDDGILFYKGRLGPDHTWTIRDLDHLNIDLLKDQGIGFNKPCLLATSPIFYSYALYVHYTVLPHAGLERTLKKIQERFHVIKPRKILVNILSACIKCKLMHKRFLEQEMSNHNQLRFELAPAFSAVMCDIASPFKVKTRFQGRQVMACPALVVVCLLTGATAIYICESEETQSIVLALERHSARFGIPALLHVDSGTSMKKLSDISFNLRDFEGLVKKNMRCSVSVSKPKNHCEQGRVEVRIRILKQLLNTLSYENRLLSFIGWETLFYKISNLMNEVPICRTDGLRSGGLEMQLITPNRLLHGRNHYRSMSGPFFLEGTKTEMLKKINDVESQFYKAFIQHLPSLITKPKWPSTSKLDVGDIVLFFMQESSMGKRYTEWHYGKVKSIVKDTVEISYTCGDSDISQARSLKFLIRAKRNLVRIAKESELNIGTRAHYKEVTAEK